MSVVSLTMNPAIDISTNVARVVPTEKLRCTSIRRDAGGGGINVARVIARLGGQVRAIYPIGGPIGEMLRQLVEAEGVASEIIRLSDDTRESFTVRDEKTGEQYRFVLPGPELSDAECLKCLAAVAQLRPAPAFFVASGSLPAGVSEDFFAKAGREAKALGAKVVVDTSRPALAATLKEGVFLVKPNLRELEELVGSPLEGREEWHAASRDLVDRGQAEIVALTLGHRGGLLVTRSKAFYAPAVPVELVSAIGAGDSFLGGMVWALGSGRSIEEAFRYGMAAGTAALLTPGTNLCRREDVARLLHEVRLQEI